MSSKSHVSHPVPPARAILCCCVRRMVANFYDAVFMQGTALAPQLAGCMTRQGEFCLHCCHGCVPPLEVSLSPARVSQVLLATLSLASRAQLLGSTWRDLLMAAKAALTPTAAKPLRTDRQRSLPQFRETTRAQTLRHRCQLSSQKWVWPFFLSF